MPQIKTQNEEELKKNKEAFDKKKIEEFKTYIENTFKSYADTYVIIDFINIHFHYKLGRKPEYATGEMQGEMVFDFQYSPPYRQCHINIHEAAYQMWETGQLEALEGGVLHELSHLHTHRLSEMAKNRFIEERELMSVNEELTQIISEYLRRLKALMQENINLKGRSSVTEKATKQRSNKQ